MSKVTVYFTAVSSSAEIKKHQKRIRDILGENYKGCEVQYMDISTSTSLRDRMRKLANNDKALPPQITKGDDYLGDYNAFDNAIEAEDIKGFLRMD